MSVTMASVDSPSHAIESSYKLMKDINPSLQVPDGTVGLCMEGSMCLLDGTSPAVQTQAVPTQTVNEQNLMITSVSVSESADILGSLPTFPPTSPTSSASPTTSPKAKGILRQSRNLESSSAFSEFNFQENNNDSPPKVGLQKRVSIQAEPSEVFTSLSVSDSEHSSAAQSLNGPGCLPDPDRRKSTDSTASTIGFQDEEDDSLLLQMPSSRKEHGRHKPRASEHKHKLQRLRSQLSLGELAENEKELKANLFFHIGNPVKRWRVERVLPIKLLLQLLKTFCLVVQIVLFINAIPNQRSDFFFNTREIFEDMFISQFDTENPRAIYNAYSVPQLFREFEFISRNYFAIPTIAIGAYSYQLDEETGKPLPIQYHLQRYARADFDVPNRQYAFDGVTENVVFEVSEGENATLRYMSESDDPLFHRFVSLDIHFVIVNIRVIHSTRAECFRFDLTVRFNNNEHTGLITYFLQETHQRLTCNDTAKIHDKSLQTVNAFLTVLDLITLCLCCISVVLTANTIRRAVRLAKAMGKFYDKQLNIELTWWERKSLFSYWHIFTIFSDICIVSGTIYKIVLDYNVTVDTGPTRVFLGTAILFQSAVILRYASYFNQLNALTRTLTLAFPELGKFLLVAGILFLAFVLAGWLVLSPYHPKFLTFNGSFDSFFSLLNGDDIYTTFELIEKEDDPIAFHYSRFLIYIFIALFIYAVLNLFTSLVISAYEASQVKDTATKNEVRRFIFSGPLTTNGVALREFAITKKYVDPQLIKQRRRKSTLLQEETEDSYELDN